MQFKNLSISKKIWLLVVSVMVLMIATNAGLSNYQQAVQTRIAQEVADYENRIRMVTEWRASLLLATSSMYSHFMAPSSEGQAIFRASLDKESANVGRLMQEVAKHIHSEEGRTQFAQLQKYREESLSSIEQVRSTRETGGDIEALMLSKTIPITQAYAQELNQFIQLHETWRDRAEKRAEEEQRTALGIGIACFLVVVVGGIALATWLIRLLTAPLHQAVSIAQRIAAGDLRQEVDVDRHDELGQLLHSLNAMRQKLRQLVSEVRGGVASLSAATQDIATGNVDLSSRTESAAAHLEETASSLEELTATVTQSADIARQANQLAASTAHAAQDGGEVVQQVVESMALIDRSSRRISDIIGVIDGIAFQTNILALNAAVEAARAGAQGRGFAVVATEVRSLASRSADAAKEIKALIATSTRDVNAGSAQVAQAGESMRNIVTRVRHVTDLIGEISAAGAEQSAGITQVNHALGNLDQMTQFNAALVEESSAAANALTEQTQRLADLIAFFQVDAHDLVRPSVVAALPAHKPNTALPSQRPAPATQAPALEALPSASATASDA